MARYLYSELANAVQARRNCAEHNNTEWHGKWSDFIDSLMEQMPSGSGFDNGTKIDLDASHAEKLVFTTAFHHMHESGMYDGWTDHTVTVTPSFSGFNMRISGRNRNDIKDYMGYTFHECLMQTVEINIEALKTTVVESLRKADGISMLPSATFRDINGNTVGKWEVTR